MTGPGSECACRLMAQMRSVDRVRKCLLFGVDGTYCGRHETDAFDPKRTWLNSLLDHLVGDGWFASHRNCSAGPFLPAAEADADSVGNETKPAPGARLVVSR